MNFDLVKLYLRDTHSKIILDDMKTPTDIQGGKVIYSKTRKYFANNEADLTKEIASELPNINYLFSFHSIDESLKQIRYGVLCLDESALIS